MSNRNNDGILTGNEDPADFANYLATIIESAMVDGGGFAVQPLREIRVTDGFQPYLTIELANGAEWQITPVRASWPQDGSSAQWASDGCVACGASLTANDRANGNDHCSACWIDYCREHDIDPETGEPTDK